jgi:hypothetical protein
MSAPAFTRAPAISEAELIELENGLLRLIEVPRMRKDAFGNRYLYDPHAREREGIRRLMELVRRSRL